jgi:hypothetical protein
MEMPRLPAPMIAIFISLFRYPLFVVRFSLLVDDGALETFGFIHYPTETLSHHS